MTSQKRIVVISAGPLSNRQGLLVERLVEAGHEVVQQSLEEEIQGQELDMIVWNEAAVADEELWYRKFEKRGKF